MTRDYDAEFARLGEWLAATPLEPTAERAARRLVLDTIACAAAGFRKVGLAHLAAESGGFRLLGSDAPLHAADAAYAFSLAACADEACEGLAFAHGRPGLHAVSAGLGAALRTDASLGALLDAVAAGFEFGGRMGALFRALPGIHVDGTWGLVASTVAARRLYGGDGPAMAAAATAALCQMPASLYLPVAQGADLRNSYSGHAASAGMQIAASLAAGMTIPTGAADAAAGYAFRRDDEAWAGTGRRLLLEGYLKPYPSVRHTHYGIEAARAWRRQHPETTAAEIGEVRLAIYPEAITYCGNRAPKTPIMGQFSLSYTLAYSLLHGGLTPDAYEDSALRDPASQALEARIALIPDEAMGADGKRGCHLSVESGGAAWSVDIDAAPGDASGPLTDAQLAEKVRTFCAGRVPSARTERLISDLLEGSPDQPVRALVLA